MIVVVVVVVVAVVEEICGYDGSTHKFARRTMTECLQSGRNRSQARTETKEIGTSNPQLEPQITNLEQCKINCDVY